MASWQDRMTQAATFAASEALHSERARCLWILDDLITQLQADFDRKILIEAQRHLAETKLKLARVIVDTAKRGIISGVRPPVPSKLGESDAKET